LVLYRQQTARCGTARPGFELELNSGPKMAFRATYSAEERPAADGMIWYALDRSILRQSGVALLGPAAKDMFAEIAPPDLRQLLIDALSWWLERPAAIGNQPAPGAEDAVLGA
jgi:hypothetical protein